MEKHLLARERAHSVEGIRLREVPPIQSLNGAREALLARTRQGLYIFPEKKKKKNSQKKSLSVKMPTEIHWYRLQMAQAMPKDTAIMIGSPMQMIK